MRILLLFFSLCCTQPLYAQQINIDRGSTYAVVVGISDYQDEAIPDLQFADNDAEAFAAFLQSETGGSLVEENIKLLTNEKATTAQIAGALDWLIEDSKDGDRAIIYFSGHGDVETKTAMQLGFLLTHDSPPTTYIAGAFPLFYLQSVITTLSQKNVQVLMVSDACRAGKLAGSEIGGTQATTANLAKQYANEIKIMSCQPNEFSLEGEQWGGGRGAFSYHLLDGLYGLADKNSDLQVNLFEIGRYLEDKVSEETSPHNQMPFTVGDRNSRIAFVDEDLLAVLQKQKETEMPTLATIETKEVEEGILAQADSSVQEMYRAFIAAVEQGNLLEPAGHSADDYYKKLIGEESLKKMHGYMKRNFAAALQDDAQVAINAYLKANPTELEKRYESGEDYDRFSEYISRAAELLGPEHIFYQSLKAKQYYFEGLLTRLNGDEGENNDSLYQVAIAQQQKALDKEPRAAYVYNELGILHSRLKLNRKAMEYYKEAITLAPEWGLPYVNYCIESYYSGDHEKAKEIGEKALERMPDYPQMYNFLAWVYANYDYYVSNKSNRVRKGLELKQDFFYSWENMASTAQKQIQFERSIPLLEKAIELDSNYLSAHYNLGLIQVNIGDYQAANKHLERAIQIDPNSARAKGLFGYNLGHMGKFEKGEALIQKSISLFLADSLLSMASSYSNRLGILYKRWGNTAKAMEQYKRAIELNPKMYNPKINLGSHYYDQQLYEKAEFQYLKALSCDDEYPVTYRYLGKVFNKMNRWKDAEWMYEKAIELNPNYILGYKYIADFYSQTRQFQKVLKWQEKILSLAPDDPAVLFYSGRSYYLSKQYKKAEQHFQKATERQVSDYSLYNEIGYFYRIHSEGDKAAKFLKKGIRLKTNNTSAHWNLAWVYLEAGEADKAQQLFDKAIVIAPTRTSPYYFKVLFYIYTNELEKANIQLEKLIELDSNYIHLQKAINEAKKGNDELASLSFETAIARFPRADNIQYLYCRLKIKQRKYEEALALLDGALAIGGRTYQFMQNDPALEPIQDLHGYQQLMREYFPEKFDDLDTFEFEEEEELYYPENCILLAKFYESQQKHDRARFLYNKAKELNLKSEKK